MGFFSKTEKRNCDTSVAGGTILEFLRQHDLGALNISTFYRGVQLISTSISQLPIVTKKITAKGGSSIVKNHYTNLLWKDRNNLVDKVTMIRQVIQDVIIKGNGYIYIQRGNDNIPVGLRYLPATDVTSQYKKESDTLYYQCSYISMRIDPEDMLHFKMWTNNGVQGISLLKYASNLVDLTNAVDLEAKDYFDKGCSNISGILKVNSQLSEKQRNQILSTWNATYSNSKAGLAVIQGNMDYQQLSNDPNTSQMLESRKYNVADVCQYLNINPAQLGLEGYSTYTSFEDANNELLTRTLMPYISMIEAELSRKLLKDDEQKNYKVILDTVAFLRPNKQTQSTYYTSLVSNGILTVNEARKELGYAEVEGGDKCIVAYTDINQNTLGNENEFGKEEGGQ